MKALLFCAAVLFPYTFWIITQILPTKIEPQTPQMDMCIILNEQKFMNQCSENAIMPLARKVK